VIAAGFVLTGYGGDSFWPGLVAGFLGTLVAFMLALMWERERERDQRRREDEQKREELEREAEQLDKRRITEARRRLEPVRTELEKNAESLRIIDEAYAGKGRREEIAASAVSEDSGRFLVNPQLLGGAWVASAPRLTELIDDYELIADLGTAYGRIEELRWRIRSRIEHKNTNLDSAIKALAGGLRDEVDGLLNRVEAQIEGPTVRPVALSETFQFFDALVARFGIVRGEGSRPSGFSAD
jgi:hypothetical protein